jgi:hypothetical protein
MSSNGISEIGFFILPIGFVSKSLFIFHPPTLPLYGILRLNKRFSASDNKATSKRTTVDTRYNKVQGTSVIMKDETLFKDLRKEQFSRIVKPN